MRGTRTFAVVLVAAFALTACSGGQRADRLKVGDCFDDVEMMSGAEVARVVTRVPSVPCDEPHDFEVFHVTNYSGGSYSFDAIADFADFVCFVAFEPYVGRRYATSIIDFTWFIPTPDSWARGDREVICIAFHMNLEKLRGSVRGTGL